MKKWMFSLFILLSFFTFTGCGDPTSLGTIKGTVIDSDGNAINSAQITASYTDGNQTATTDASGEYLLTQLPSTGTVTTTVTKAGYLKAEQSVSDLADTTATLNFTLIKDETAPIIGKVNGTITDISGKPLEGAVVHSSLAQTITNSRGSYALDAPVGEHVTITVDLINYAQASRNTVVNKTEVTHLNISLVPVDKITTFDVNNGVTVETKGASVTFSASSIVYEDGSAFDGNVTAKIYFNQVTNETGKSVFPGDFVGKDSNGVTVALISYGFLNVTLEDSDGNSLRIADGMTAKLTYPKDSKITDTPSSIALSYFDTEQGVWIQDGIATYNAGTNSYEGVVSHFTTWDLNEQYQPASLQGCVEDSNGTKVQLADISLDATGYINAYTNNDDNGNFSFINVPSNKALTLFALTQEGTSEKQTVTLQAGETKVLTQCLVINKNSIDPNVKITGQLLFPDGLAVKEQTLNIKYSDDSFVDTVETDLKGEFSSDYFARPNDETIILTDNILVDTPLGSQSVLFEESFKVDPTQNIIDLGQIEVKMTTIKGCFQRADGSRLFDIVDIYENKQITSGVDSDGNIYIITEKDFNVHTYQIIADPLGDKSTVFSITADRDLIDLGSNCLVVQ